MVRVTDPEESITIDIDANGELRVDRAGKTILEPSPYGMPTPYGSFPEDFELEDVRTRKVDESYELTHGKQSNPRHRAVEKTLVFEGDGGTVDFQVRAAVDGIAYRYTLRGKQEQYLHPGDESGFRFPPGTVAWLSDYQANHEGHSRQVPITAVDGEYNLPGLFRVDDTWALVCEAGADGDWMAGRLVAMDDTSGVNIGFPESHPTSHIWADDPATTPWRVVVVGNLGTVVESTLTTDLVDGPRIDDNWFDPGRVAWSWWSSGSNDRTLEEQRAYVDYAAERGWEYTLVDAGWNDEWLPELVSYADDKGVNIELWSHFMDLNTESKRTERLSKWANWGVAGIKVDFMDSDDQGRLQFYEDLARDAAEYKLTVNFHGSAVPTGLRRRWPHLMTYEGVRGAEYYKWATNTPEHNVTLPFTRNVVGPMDYTPVTFSAERRTTSMGHELAQSVVYESGLQHYADSIETYESYPLAERVLEVVPAAWDETRFLRGHPGSEATFARRRDDDWFVGSITAGPNRSVEVPLSFLPEETTAVITTDDDDGTGLTEYEQMVSPDDSIRVSIADNGGFVVRL